MMVIIVMNILNRVRRADMNMLSRYLTEKYYKPFLKRTDRIDLIASLKRCARFEKSRNRTEKRYLKSNITHYT